MPQSASKSTTTHAPLRSSPFSRTCKVFILVDANPTRKATYRTWHTFDFTIIDFQLPSRKCLPNSVVSEHIFSSGYATSAVSSANSNWLDCQRRPFAQNNYKPCSNTHGRYNTHTQPNIHAYTLDNQEDTNNPVSVPPSPETNYFTRSL